MLVAKVSSFANLTVAFQPFPPRAKREKQFVR